LIFIIRFSAADIKTRKRKKTTEENQTNLLSCVLFVTKGEPNSAVVIFFLTKATKSR
jgi:hypothetical protein